MSYLHIANLYKDQRVLLFKECYALEKIHGTSAHLSWAPTGGLKFFAGGESHERFVSLFDQDKLSSGFKDLGAPPDQTITVYGEAYGGKQQGMSDTYGKELKFIAFDVQIGDNWLDVPNAEQVCQKLGIEFVHYVKVPTDLASLDEQRDAPSIQAIRNGVSVVAKGEFESMLTNPRKREGIVLRPLIEVTLNNDQRVISKHKGDEFKETATPRKVVDPSKLAVLADAQAVAHEWVTTTRLEHVLDKLPGHCMEKMRDILSAMTEDVLREGAGEIVDTPEVRKAITTKTALMYKDRLKAQLVASQTT